MFLFIFCELDVQTSRLIEHRADINRPASMTGPFRLICTMARVETWLVQTQGKSVSTAVLRAVFVAVHFKGSPVGF